MVSRCRAPRVWDHSQLVNTTNEGFSFRTPGLGRSRTNLPRGSSSQLRFIKERPGSFSIVTQLP